MHRFPPEKLFERTVDNSGECDTIYYKHHIVAYKKSRDKHILMTGEHLDYPVDESSSCGIYLHPDLARLHESYFGTGEQTGENYGHKV